MDVCTLSYERGQSFNREPVGGRVESAIQSSEASTAGGLQVDPATCRSRPSVDGAGFPFAAGFPPSAAPPPFFLRMEREKFRPPSTSSRLPDPSLNPRPCARDPGTFDP